MPYIILEIPIPFEAYSCINGYWADGTHPGATSKASEGEFDSLIAESRSTVGPRIFFPAAQKRCSCRCCCKTGALEAIRRVVYKHIKRMKAFERLIDF